MTAIITKNGAGVPPSEALQKGELAVDLEGLKLYTSTDGSDVVEVSGADSPWVFVEDWANPYPYIRIGYEWGEDAPHSEGYYYQVAWSLDADSNYLWLDGTGGRSCDFEEGYFWDFSADVAEFGWVANSRAASRRAASNARRAEKGIPVPMAAEPPEIPIVVHGKIQANDVVDADGNSLLGGGDFEMPEVIDGGTY